MRFFKKMIAAGLVLVTLLSVLCMNVSAATIGQSLTSPEAGWHRFDDADSSKFILSGTMWRKSTYYSWYQNYCTQTNGSGDNVTFKFKGTKLRIIGAAYDYGSDVGSTNISVNIDGIDVGTFSQKDAALIIQSLNYEISNLENTTHIVKITNNTTGMFWFDAVDIDDTGTILPYYQPTNLQVTAGDKNVTLKWNPVEGATSYNIKYGTSSGNYMTPYLSASISQNSGFTISNLTNGTKYYFTVSAIVNGVEKENAAEVFATPIGSSIIQGNRAILVITMTNGTQKEYDMSASEIEAFVKWYDDKDNGVAGTKAYFAIKKTANIKPFLNRWDYIVFSKIQDFEIKDYNE